MRNDLGPSFRYELMPFSDLLWLPLEIQPHSQFKICKYGVRLGLIVEMLGGLDSGGGGDNSRVGRKR